MSLMPDTILSEFCGWLEHGYRVHPVGSVRGPSFPDGRVADESRGPEKRKYEEFAATRRRTRTRSRGGTRIGGLAAVLGPLLMSTPPQVGSKRPMDLLEQLRLVWRFRRLDVTAVGDVTRLMTMSVADLLDDCSSRLDQEQ